MAKEKITTLVEQLHDKLISNKSSEHNEALIVDEIRQSNYLEDKAANQKFLEHMLNLMGYFAGNSNPPQWKTVNNPPTQSEFYFRKLFWLDSYCREFLLQDLLGSSTNTPQMAAIFQSFEHFYELPEYRRTANRILRDAFEYLPAESTWFAYYYSCSEKVEPKNKREEVVENNLRNFDQYYTEPAILAKVLENNSPVREKIAADATSLGNRLRRKLKEFLGERFWRFLDLLNPLDENIGTRLDTASRVQSANHLQQSVLNPATVVNVNDIQGAGLSVVVATAVPELEMNDNFSRFNVTAIDEQSNSNLGANQSLDSDGEAEADQDLRQFERFNVSVKDEDSIHEGPAVPNLRREVEATLSRWDSRVLRPQEVQAPPQEEAPAAPRRKGSYQSLLFAAAEDQAPSPIQSTKQRSGSLDLSSEFPRRGAGFK